MNRGIMLTAFVFLKMTLSCGFNFSVPDSPSKIIPRHGISSEQPEGLSSRQESYVHTSQALILSETSVKASETDDDNQFWKTYLNPFESGEKSTATLINELSGQDLSQDHTISRYRCRLVKDGARSTEASGALISYQINDPCSSSQSTFALLFSGNSDHKLKAYFFSALAETLESSVKSGTEAIHRDLKAYHFQVINSLKFSDSTIAFGKVNQTMVVYFHGSISNSDWQSNLTFHLQPADWYQKGAGLVHSGFDQTVQRIWPDLRAILNDYPDVTETFFVGFSRGGALASLTALKWSLQGHTSYAYTFGQPRFGDKLLINFVARQPGLSLHRIVNQEDMVPRLPPVNSSLPYFNFLFKL